VSGPAASGPAAARGPAERCILAFDRALRALAPPAAAARRVPYPAEDVPENTLSSAERAVSAGLMRVNHAGEVSAQALYHGQSLLARAPRVRSLLQQAAAEETDHLRWCERRLTELDARPSRLGPLWYLGAFGTGLAAAAAGDRWSLGFVAETERQVEAHLGGHLERLPGADHRSRAIIERMRADEERHGGAARAAGAARMPRPVQRLMALQARVMTTVAYWI